ncbi:recombinase family protein [Aminipila butyrica]|uniref:Recombinase family protein n=1 Tax=Aminipila butyrica TaxID=433296 RepID=A0A858BWY7_9FIRM|nr:recombinase family protein [Aminipila butyrica]QIB69605.1 recombinase family protein [Aminipila butyrica]
MSKELLARYIRLSKEDAKTGESNSISNQRELIKAFVEESFDLSQYEMVEFCDDGYSGTNFERPGIKLLFEEVRKGNIRCIIVKDLSRFGRNYIEMGDYLEQIFPFLGVRFISVNDRFDSSHFDGTTGGLGIGFKNLSYALYSKDLSQKVRSARKTRMENGEFISSHAPYGYAKSLSNRKQLVVDENAADVVRRIFTMAEAGKNAVQIAVHLNNEKIPTPSAYKQLVGCNHKCNIIGNANYWLNTTVLTILRDERYTGKMVSGKNYSPVVGCKHSKRTPKSEWIIVPGTHEAIISEELFAFVQESLVTPVRRKTEPHVSRPLMGKLKCGVCKHAMRRSNSDTSMGYYYCESHRYITDSNCTKERVVERDLIQHVLAMIHIQIGIFVDMEQRFGPVRGQEHHDIFALTEQLKQHQAALAKGGAAKIRAYEKYREGILNRDNYIRLKADIRRQLAKTETQIAELETALRVSYAESHPPYAILEEAKGCEGVTELSKEIADELIDSLYVYGSGVIEIVWNYADEYEKAAQAVKQGARISDGG